MDYFSRGVPAVQFHNRSPSITEILRFASYNEGVVIKPLVAMFQSNGVLSESCDNFIPAAHLWFQITNSMSSRKNVLKKY